MERAALTGFKGLKDNQKSTKRVMKIMRDDWTVPDKGKEGKLLNQSSNGKKILL